ncbi:MAG: hypothetical protein RJQ14_27900 [Marinoscillum sp.]
MPRPARGFFLDTAESMCSEMSGLLAAMNGERAVNNSSKTTRDKAYTFLKRAMDEIREAGKYVFWKNPDKLQWYYSARWTNR